jgi:hypothetical protein
MAIKFNVKVNVKKKYIVDGKEYDSIEAMPEGIRTAYEAALSARKEQAGSAESAGQAEAREIAKEEEQVRAMEGHRIEPPLLLERSIRRTLLWLAIFILILVLFALMRRAGAH